MFAKRREVPDPDLNLIPIMNLFVALIPFLLLSAVFFHLRVIRGSVPAATEGQTDIAKGPDTVTMTVQIDPAEGFHVSASSATLAPDEMAKLGKTIPKKGKVYDYATLSQVMRGVKRQWDQSDTVIIVADPKVKLKSFKSSVGTESPSWLVTVAAPPNCNLALTRLTVPPVLFKAPMRFKSPPLKLSVPPLTLAPAEILGVGDRLGSIEPGKSASLIVTDGDPLEIRTHVEMAFIDGREVALDENRHRRLYERYRSRPRVAAAD